MSKNLKESMGDEMLFAAEREGIPDLMDRIADGSSVSTVDELVAWVKEKNHPVLEMSVMEASHSELQEEVQSPEEETIEKAEAVVDAVLTKQEKPAEVKKVEPKVAKKVAAPAAAALGVSEDRAERAVNMLRRALMAALAELGGLDMDELQQAVGTQAGPVEQQKPFEAPSALDEAAVVKLPPDAPWLKDKTQTKVVKEKWSGSVREVTIGATSADGGTRTSVVTVGGETAMPFMDFEGSIPNAPALAIEIMDRRPDDWSEKLLEEWGNVVDDPARWAKAAEEAGADLLLLRLSVTDAEGNPNSPENAVAVVKAVLEASGLPLIVFGPGQAEVDNELLVKVGDAFKGERLLLGICEDKNYRTIVATAMANGHLVDARTAMDVNLAKQLNILISDMDLPLEQIVMDPTTGALGYGFEYGYSVMERLRLAALQGDNMTQMPMLVTPGEECWKIKESKVGEGVPEEWGDWLERGITWETLTSVMLVESGANILVLRHPESLRRTRVAVNDLMKKA